MESVANTSAEILLYGFEGRNVYVDVYLKDETFW